MGTTLPWAVLPALSYLAMYWLFVSGAWGADGAAWRRAQLRAHRLSGGLWVKALGAGALGFVALIAVLVLAARLVPLPAGSPISTPVEMPAITVFSLLVMASVVAGVSEEAAFRGYMQSMIERRFGVVVAILANGTLFGLLHFGNHPSDVVVMLPYYIAVSAVYGGLTWATNSILPAVVLHSVGDIAVLSRWWLTGRPEWQIGATAPPLVWDSGIDAPLVVVAVTASTLIVATALAYRALRRAGIAPRNA